MSRAPRLLWLGTYESDYPRTRVLHAGLRELGAEPLACHRPVWELTRHKAGEFLSPRRLPKTAALYARARDLSLRTAATALAVERVAEAHRLRGLYP